MFKTFVVTEPHPQRLETEVEKKIRKFLEENPTKNEVSRTTSISSCSVGSLNIEFNYVIAVTCKFE